MLDKYKVFSHTLKFIFVIGLTFNFLAVSTAQTAETASDPAPEKKSKNIIKYNLFGIVAQANSWQAERALTKNFSVALTYAAIKKQPLPTRITNELQFEDPMMKLMQMQGRAITGEIRYYPGKKIEKQAPRGFYLAPYIRSAKYEVSSQYVYKNSSNNPASWPKGSLDVKFSALGYGLSCGYQWVISNHISIDWTIVGAHYGKSKISGSFSSPELPNTLGEDVSTINIDADLNDAYPFNGTHASITYSTASGVGEATFDLTKVNWYGLRTAISIGFAF